MLCGAKVARGLKEEEFVELKWLIPKPLCTRLTFKSVIKNNFTEYLNKLFWNIVERQIKKVISFLFNQWPEHLSKSDAKREKFDSTNQFLQTILNSVKEWEVITFKMKAKSECTTDRKEEEKVEIIVSFKLRFFFYFYIW